MKVSNKGLRETGGDERGGHSDRRTKNRALPSPSCGRCACEVELAAAVAEFWLMDTSVR